MRKVITIVVLIALVAGLGVVKGKQIGMLIAFGKEAERNGPPPETVSTAKATAQTWEVVIPSIGNVTSVKGVTVSNDAPGVITAIHFESGANVHQGDVLVELESGVERAQFASAQARRELAAITEGRTRALYGSNAVPLAQLDNDERLLKASGADVGAIQAQIARKVVRAPFSGRLGIRNVNLGQYLNPGTAITVLESLDAVYVDFTLPQKHLDDVVVGTKVRVTIDGAKNPNLEGAISAIDPSLDQVTRSIRIRAAMSTKNDELRPGMFGTVEVVLAQHEDVIAVPATAIVHASYGDSVFVVEQKTNPGTGPTLTARQQFVKVTEHRGDFVAVDGGVTAGQEIVSAGAFKLRNNAAIVVNDTVKLEPSLTPRPANH